MIPVQALSIAIYGLVAILFVAPALKRLDRGVALSWLVGLHLFRYVVLYVFIAQREGYSISDTAATEYVTGDLTGVALALVGVILLRGRRRLGIAAAWLLVAATLVDFSVGIYQRAIDPPHAPPAGVWWLIFNFYVPALFVTVPLLIWQLAARRGEPLGVKP